MKTYKQLSDTQAVLCYLVNLCQSKEAIERASKGDSFYLFNNIAKKYVDYAKQYDSLDKLGSVFTLNELEGVRHSLKKINRGIYGNSYNKAIINIFGYSANI